MPQDNNTDIIVRSVAEYRKVRDLAREVKDGNTTAINFSARLLAASVREIAKSLSKDGKAHLVLVPMPGRDGIANYTQELAKKTGKLLGLPVENALLSDVHQPLYELKKKQRSTEKEPVQMVQVKRIPKGMTPVLIDNVLDTGKTAVNAAAALDSEKVCLAVIGDTGKFEGADLTYNWRVNRSMVFHGGKIDMLMRDALPVKGDTFKADGTRYTVLDSDLRRGYLTTVDSKGKIKNWDLFAQDNAMVSLSVPKLRKAKKNSQDSGNKRYTYYIYSANVKDEAYPRKGLLSAETFGQGNPPSIRLSYNRPLTYSELKIYGIKPSQEIMNEMTGNFLRKSGSGISNITVKASSFLGKGHFDVSIESAGGTIREAMSWLDVMYNIEHKRWKPSPSNIQSQTIPHSSTTVMEQDSNQSVKMAKAASKKANSRKPTLEEYIARIKGKNPNTLVLFRSGDFYEFHGEDAEKASNVLRIPITRSDDGTRQTATFPRHSLDTYLPKLIRSHYRVAICDDYLSEELKPKAKVVNLNEPAEKQLGKDDKQQAVKDMDKFVDNIRAMYDPSHTKVAVFPPVNDAIIGREGITIDRCYLWDNGISFGANDANANDAKRIYFHPKDIRHEAYAAIENAVSKALVPSLTTSNGQNVYNLRAVESRNGKCYLTGHLDAVGLHPKEITKEDFQGYSQGTVSARDIFTKYYPTKMARHLSKEEFNDMTLSDGSTLTKVNVYKQDNPERPNHGKYMVYAEKDDKRLFSEPLSHEQLDRWFDKTVSKGTFAEEVLGEKLHLASAYERYRLHVPDDTDVKVRIFKDIQGNWNVQAHIDGHGYTGSHTLSYDDKCSLFGKTATKEQLAAKYCNEELRSLHQGIMAKKSQSKSLTL